MYVLRMLNKLLGAILLPLFFVPIIALVSISRLFNFIDLLYQGKIGQAFVSLIASPFTAIATAVLGVTSLAEHGWKSGLATLITTLPARTIHFFKKQIPFGSQEDEIVNNLFVSSYSPSGFEAFVTSGFFGKLTLKLLSLCFPMEIYLSYDAKTISPHNDVSLYFTENNLSLLKEKYELTEREHSAQILMEIENYLSGKLNEAHLKVEEISHLSSSDDTKVGKLQSAQDELCTIESAQRCIDYFTKNHMLALDLSNRFQCTPATVLNYVWLAINAECPNEYYNLALKEKLSWALFQIQRGFNIVNDGDGADMPECPTGAIGLLVRVVCDEQEKMPDSEYKAADPSPANLSLALKSALDRPFSSSYEFIMRSSRLAYNSNPQSYKQAQKENISRTWKTTFSPLLSSGVLQEEALDQIIAAGVDAWEPPEELAGTTFSNPR